MLAENNDPEISRQYLGRMFLPKGQTDLDTLLRQSVIGPIGLPAVEAAYPPIHFGQYMDDFYKMGMAYLDRAA